MRHSTILWESYMLWMPMLQTAQQRLLTSYARTFNQAQTTLQFHLPWQAQACCHFGTLTSLATLSLSLMSVKERSAATILSLRLRHSSKQSTLLFLEGACHESPCLL